MTLMFTGALALQSCSSSPSSGSDSPDNPAAADAATDPLPSDNPEAAASPAPDPGAAPTADAGALPPPSDSPAPPPSDTSTASAPTPPADTTTAAATPPSPPASEPATPPADTSSATASASPSDGGGSGGGGGSGNYTVQTGDTLMKIAFETYGDLYKWKSIYEANRGKIKNPNAIPAGTVLNIEKPANPVSIERNGDKYVIKKGDTLGKIAYDIYGTKKKWKKIWENNKQLIKNPNRIFAGLDLYYSITPEEKQEADRLRQQSPSAPSVQTPPLANSAPPVPAPDNRVPASVPASAPANVANPGGANSLPPAPQAPAH